ncbi:MAG: TatD DNase family protein [Patescibacteria group bacterium]|nr:TatD DNase family protein [Patescibacteria group bacterium]
MSNMKSSQDINPIFTHIDTHAHVNFPVFDADRTEVITRAQSEGVAMINVGTTLDASRDIVALTEQYESGVYAIVGMHPLHVKYDKNNSSQNSTADIEKEADQETIASIDTPIDSSAEIPAHYSHDYTEHFNEVEFEKLISHPKVVGVGECGIDIFRLSPELDNETDRAALLKLQETVFRKQIQLAVKYDKPIMIHARESYTKILEILDEEFITHGAKLRGNAHFFAGTVEEAQAFLDRGFTVSFTGVITFAKQYEELVRYVPLEKMLSETDCPFVAPAPHRGKRNEPVFVKEVVKKIAEIKGLDEELVRASLLENAKRQFRIEF